ncbi:MAG: hypothetical protein P1U63_06070 [Coxiellaceae bacterium]|nr:hypothetical protein [Coxiellaceae bacterium]
MSITTRQHEVAVDMSGVNAGPIQPKKPTCNMSAKHASMFIAALTAVYGISIFLGPNYFQVKPEDRNFNTYANTASALIINFFVMFEIGRESLGDACTATAATARVVSAKCRGLDPRQEDRDNLPTLIGSSKAFVYTTVSAFATVIYADIAPTLADSPLSFINTPAGYAGLMFANLFFHYYGTKGFVNTTLTTAQDAISDWMITLGPSKSIRDYYLARSIDRDITQYMEKHLADSQLAHEVEYSKDKSKVLPQFNDSKNFHENAATLAIDHRTILTHATAQSRLQKTLFTTLYASIIVALVPFFTDSFGVKPVKLMSFIGTTIANLGLTLLFTNKYSNALSKFMLYRNVPPIFSDAKNNKGRVACAAAIVAVNATLTYFTVNTTMKLFEAIVKSHIKSQLENSMLVAGIWIGTIAFNVYAINQMVLGKVSDKVLKDDPRYQFSTAADKLRKQLPEQLLKDRHELRNKLESQFPNGKKNLWARHLDNGITDHANIKLYTAERQQASSRVNRNLYMGVLPLAAAATLMFVLSKQLKDNDTTELAIDLGKYGVFVLAQVASQIYHKYCAAPDRDTYYQMTRFASEQSLLSKPLLQEDKQLDDKIDSLEGGQNTSTAGAMGNTGSPKTEPAKRPSIQQAKAACSLFRMIKGAAVGMAVEWAIRGLYAGLDTTIPENAVDTAATALGLTASFSLNRC